MPRYQSAIDQGLKIASHRSFGDPRSHEFCHFGEAELFSVLECRQDLVLAIIKLLSVRILSKRGRQGKSSSGQPTLPLRLWEVSGFEVFNDALCTPANLFDQCMQETDVRNIGISPLPVNGKGKF